MLTLISPVGLLYFILCRVLMNRYGWEGAFGLSWIAPLELSAEFLPDIFIFIAVR